jgi:hypothetical protein
VSLFCKLIAGAYRPPVVLWVVVVELAAGVVTDSREVDVVEVVVAGLSTTVVQELSAIVIVARAGTRMMSFFIVGSPSHRRCFTR